MDRRDVILFKIRSRLIIKDTGFTINGEISPCHIWSGPLSGNGRGHGYGRMSLEGRTVAVHIVVATHYFGYIPGNKQVDHLCNIRSCCNKNHLSIVSHKVNQKRRTERKKNNEPSANT